MQWEHLHVLVIHIISQTFWFKTQHNNTYILSWVYWLHCYTHGINISIGILMNFNIAFTALQNQRHSHVLHMHTS